MSLQAIRNYLLEHYDLDYSNGAVKARSILAPRWKMCSLTLGSSPPGLHEARARGPPASFGGYR